MKKFLLSVAFSLFITAASAQGAGQLQSGQIWGNPTAAKAPATGTTIGAILDRQLGCTGEGSIAQRGASVWACLAPGTIGLPLLSGGAGALLSYGQLDLTAAVKNILPGANGGTNNGFMQFSGPASTLKTYTLPNSNSTLGALGTAQTWSANQTFSAQAVFTGATAPASAAGNTIIAGALGSFPSWTNNGQAMIWNTAVGGIALAGIGSTDDLRLINKNGGTVLNIPTGTTVPQLPNLANGTCSNGLALDSSNNIVKDACPGAAASIQVGTTTVTSGTTGNILYNNAGTLGNLPRSAPSICQIISTSATTCNNGGSAANNGTYTTPAGALYIRIRMVGGGGGGGGGGSSGGFGTNGTASTFSGGTLSAGGGVGAVNSFTGGAGGPTSGGNVINLNGGAGGGSSTVSGAPSGGGGSSCLGGAPGGSGSTTAGQSAVPNSGSGGAGGGGTSVQTGSGGGSGGCLEHMIISPASTYTYAVGAAGGGGSFGTGGGGGGSGAAGQLIIEAYFN